MKVELLLCCVILSHCLELSLSARILLVLPFPGKSHHLFPTAIMKALAKRGHHMVEYSPYAPRSPIPNHTHIELHTRFENEIENWTYEDFLNHPAEYDTDFYGFKMRRIWNMNRGVCEDTFSDEKIQQLLKSNSKFDLVMTESTFGEESLLVFGHRFSAPTITIEPFIPYSQLNWVSGNTLSLASVPDLFSDTFDAEVLSIKDKILNIVSIFLTLAGYHSYHIPFHDQLVKKYFPHPDTPSVFDMVTNVSLYLTNSHPQAVNYIQPYTPNIVPVGGLHIPPDVTPLPQDIKSFLDSAEEGFIYFSLGTVVPTHVFPKEILQIFINVFKQLSQKVLWKIDLEKLDNIPNNVKITKWVPQLGVLEHPNCRLFITHGGLFSHHEAMYAGVPTVGFSFFADQPYNLQYNVIRGRGVRLDFATLEEKSLHSAVLTVLTNKRYKEAAVRMSRVYRDRPVHPLDTAVFWVEYVLRHGGAPHLRPASTRLSWYQLALLDVLGVILAVSALIGAILYTLLKWLLALVFGRKEPQKISCGRKKN